MRGMIRDPSPFRAMLLFLLVALLALSLAACTVEEKREEIFRLPQAPALPPEPGDIRTGLLYYPDGQWRFLVPLQKEIHEAETIIHNTLEQLIDTPQLQKELSPLGLVPLLTEETAILGIHIDEGGSSRVDFNGAFLGYDPAVERLVLGGLLSTLRQFPEIKGLEIMIDGVTPERFPGGTPGLLPLDTECPINLEVDDTLKDYRNFTTVTVYFCFLAPEGLILHVPVTRAILPADDAAFAAVNELLAGPRRGSGLFSDIPPGTALRSLHLEEEGLMVIDLTEEVLAYEGGCTGAENMINQILLTLGCLEGVGEVQILVEGNKVKLPDGFDITIPLKPPRVYNCFNPPPPYL